MHLLTGLAVAMPIASAGNRPNDSVRITVIQASAADRQRLTPPVTIARIERVR